MQTYPPPPRNSTPPSILRDDCLVHPSTLLRLSLVGLPTLGATKVKIVSINFYVCPPPLPPSGTLLGWYPCVPYSMRLIADGGADRSSSSVWTCPRDVLKRPRGWDGTYGCVWKQPTCTTVWIRSSVVGRNGCTGCAIHGMEC